MYQTQQQKYGSRGASQPTRYSSQHGGHQYGGAPSYQPPGPPSGVDHQLWQWFQAVDGDRSGSISVLELQAALVNGKTIEFTLLCG